MKEIKDDWTRFESLYACKSGIVESVYDFTKSKVVGPAKHCERTNSITESMRVQLIIIIFKLMFARHQTKIFNFFYFHLINIFMRPLRAHIVVIPSVRRPSSVVCRPSSVVRLWSLACLSIIFETARRISKKFCIGVLGGEVPAPVDFRVVPTTLTPPSGHFVSELGNPCLQHISEATRSRMTRFRISA